MQSSESKATTGKSLESLLGRGDGPAEFSEGSKVPFEQAWQFIVKVGLAAHRYGSTAGRLETFLVDLSKKFGYQGVFRSTPSDIVFALRKSPDSPQRVEFIATPAPGVDLDKLARLGDLLQELQAGTLTLADSAVRLDAIDKVPPPWGRLASMLGYAFTGLGLAPLLGGGWADTIFATLFSILVYGLVLLSARLGPFASDWLPFSSTAGFVTPLAAMGPANPVEPVWMWLLVPTIIVGLCLAFQTSHRDLLWAALVCGIAYLGILAGRALLDSNLGNLVGTIIAVVVANLWARKTGRPSSIVLIPAIVLLVSGSIGFRGLASMAGGDLLLGTQQFLQMFVVAMTIFVGIVIGYTLIRPQAGL